MRTLILGASGYIGARLYDKLLATDWAQPTRGSRNRVAADAAGRQVQVDSRNLEVLTRALQGYDCVINCVAGDFDSIASGARILVQAAAAAQCRRIVHLSSMAVYGHAQGEIDERAPLDPTLGWYARAKCEAEAQMGAFARDGGEAVILRPGCVTGWGSELWVGRIARWLRSGRLGDLGALGDGWSNLVHVDDVCEAVTLSMRLPIEPHTLPVFNLSAPDSPRWNDYFVDLAIAIGAIPVRRISARQLKFDSTLAGPPLKVAEKLLDRLGVAHRWLPDPIPPSVTRLFAQDIRLKARAATEVLALHWTGYAPTLEQSAHWVRGWR